ncbi:arsenite S-adenosylmethyltransferase, partial [bacterium]|nr:arsenite S-adenosylmethyltransferase [bacterium]
MSDIKSFEIRNNVSKTYASIAKNGGSCCCGSSLGASPLSASQKMGYSSEELETVPDGANLGLGCGNPQVIASLQP